MSEESEYNWPTDLRVLVVEDNKVNQTLVKGILKMFTIQGDMAANGLIALEKLTNAPQNNPYTLVLMDCQMPEMDGYAATIAIRNGEAGERNKAIPIIAMTANVLEGSKSECLQAGMDDYVSKPINIPALKDKIQQWVTHTTDLQSSTQATEERNTQEIAAPIIWDKETALHRVMGDEASLQTIIQVFLDDTPDSIKKIKQAVVDKDTGQITHFAHAIKGSAANLGFLQLQAQASLVEQSAKMKDIILVVERLPSLFDAYAKLNDYLSKEIKISKMAHQPDKLMNQVELGLYLQQLKLKLEKSIFIDHEKLSLLNKLSTTEEVKNLSVKIQEQINQFNYGEALVLLAELAGNMNCDLNKEY